MTENPLLETINASRNSIKAFPSNFKTLIFLRKLELNHNVIESIPENFSHLLLNALYLNHNQIKSLPSLVLPCLEILNISENVLIIDKKSQGYMPSLKSLEL